MPPPAHGLASRLIAGPTLRTQSDRRLVRLVREGYETAFEEIVRRYGRQLGRYAAGIVGPRCEDVTQDAFSKALLALRRDDADIELRPWLYRIVRNAALNDLRDRPAAAAELAEAIAADGNPAETVERRQELADLMEQLRALPEAQRAAIVMRELEGLGHEEIAAALGMSGGAARQAIYRARQALRDGAGMLVPLPLLKALLAGEGAAAAEAATGAAGIAGAGMAVKATAATVLVAGTVGAGVAIQENRGGREPDGAARAAEPRATPEVVAPATAPLAIAGDDSSSGPGSGGSSGRSGDSDDGRRDEREDESDRDDSSGRSGGGSGDSGEDRSGRSRSGSSNHGGSDDAGDLDDRSGPGDGSEDRSGSGSGSSGSGSGSSGSGSSGADFENDDSATSGSSGSGSSGSGSSGSESSGSSGSGSEPSDDADD